MSEPFIPATLPPEAQFATQGVQPPSSLYVGPEDKLRLLTVNALAGVRVRLEGRLLLTNGEISPFVFEVVPASTRTTEAFDFSLAEGFLLGFIVYGVGVSQRRGQLYARVQLMRASGSNAAYYSQLVSDYVADMYTPAYPGNFNRENVGGPGVLRSITGTDPAAGVEISETVPTGARWNLVSMVATLTTDATAANRISKLIIDDGVTPVFVATPNEVTTASQAQRHQTTQGVSNISITAVEAAWPIPVPLVLPAGYRIRTETAALQAGDNWGAPQLYVEEWLEP